MDAQAEVSGPSGDDQFTRKQTERSLLCGGSRVTSVEDSTVGPYTYDKLDQLD